MKKYKIKAPVEYVMGHLNYGYYTGIVDLDEKRLDDDNYIYEMIRSICQFAISDYDIDDIGEIVSWEIEEVKE